MKNVKIKEKDGIVQIQIDTNQSHGMSKSGKTETIASTQGNKEIVDGVFLGLNCYRYPEK